MAKVVLNNEIIEFYYDDTNVNKKTLTFYDKDILFENSKIVLANKTNYDNKPEAVLMKAIPGVTSDNNTKLFLEDDNIKCYTCYTCYSCFNCNSCAECASNIQCASCVNCQNCDTTCFNKNVCSACAGGCNNCVSACYSNYECKWCVSACQVCVSCVNVYNEGVDYYKCATCFDCYSSCHGCYGCLTYVANPDWHACGMCYEACHGAHSANGAKEVDGCLILNGCFKWCYGCWNSSWCVKNDGDFSINYASLPISSLYQGIEGSDPSIEHSPIAGDGTTLSDDDKKRANAGEKCANCDGACTQCNSCTGCLVCQTCNSCQGCNSCQTCDGCTSDFDNGCKLNLTYSS